MSWLVGGLDQMGHEGRWLMQLGFNLSVLCLLGTLIWMRVGRDGE